MSTCPVVNSAMKPLGRIKMEEVVAFVKTASRLACLAATGFSLAEL
ncbi:MAG: hypothetical protein ABI988_14735 [Nitrospirota bacterium]